MNLPKGHCLQNGKYRLTEVIGQGGFGITYSGVWNTEVKGELGTMKTDVPVCIKEYFFKDYCSRNEENLSVQVHSETGKILFDRFKEKQIKEAKILSEVHHPYIVNVLEVFEENNTAYIAMEYISGCSLKYMLDVEEKLPENKVLKFINQIGQALDFVHKKNILHLDIKPNNILIDKQNNARLIDFGVSKRYDIEQQETSTTMLTLSKGFASIEQYDNEGTINFSPCPDVYSLGATMYNLLTGVIPTESILRATKPLVKPSELNAEITPKTEDVILRAMRINPTDRYQTIKELVNELDIPSYFEETENLLKEPFDNTNVSKTGSTMSDEATEVYNITSGKQSLIDEEQTIVHSLKETKRVKKKHKRRILIPVMVFFFAFVGYAISFIFSVNRSNQGIDLMAIVQPVDESTEVVEGASDQSDIASETAKNDAVGSSNSETTVTKKDEPKSNTRENLIAERKPDVEVANEIVLSSDQIDAEFSALLASGKAKMDKNNFLDAKKDFAKAKELKVTEEIIRLEIACGEKEEEVKAAARKALYEVIKPYGNNTVVREKSSQLLGVIDSKGNVLVEIIYLHSGTSSDGIAFQRKDLLWDIYNVRGEIVGRGLNSY